ncbi:hypothetical protein JOB18_026300 [Solea senegalensis]|uniref:Uncharacterized protein n=1 Tax=Solea senegalensis TaxID=28829 RepID=A0AAV6QPS7_SOLSE|nr:uncharacterized protein si:ch73-303b9.1 [Solea senegalensis]KAG7494218.1 hypothetical protein JOB18_026300 [Solea senegalensis]
MEKVSVIADMKTFECSSPSELDRRFFEEQSLMSALSLEQLSTSRVSNEMVADRSDAKTSSLAFLCVSSDPVSSPQTTSMNNLNTQERDGCHLAVPLQGKSSTPCMLLQKQKKSTFFDQSYCDLTASQMSWDVSLIKSESNSPKPFTESSALEPTWSPNPQSMQLSVAGLSP